MSGKTPRADQTIQTEWFYDDRGARVGPITGDAICERLKRGDISLDTLVWNKGFGHQWRPILETELARFDAPPPLPASRVNDMFAWLLVLVPIVGAVGERMAANVWGVTPSATQALWIYAAINSVLALSDANYIARSGRNTKNIKLSVWFWLVPAYLFQRGRALGRGFTYFWAWMISFACAFFIIDPEMLSGNIYWGTGLPGCDSSFTANQVKSIFKDIPLMHLAGIQAINVREQSEVSQTDNERRCKVTVLGSDATSYTVSVTIDRRGEQVFTSLRIAQ